MNTTLNTVKTSVKANNTKIRVGLLNHDETGEPLIMVQFLIDNVDKQEVVMPPSDWMQVLDLIKEAIDESHDFPRLH